MNDCLTEFAIRKYSMLFVHTLKSILRFDLAKCFFNLGIVDKAEDKNSHDIWHIESKDMFEKITCND